jgi:hypothetical protein
MSQVPAMKIAETRAQGNYSFYPVVDDLLVFSDYAARAEKGKLARLVSTSLLRISPCLEDDMTADIGGNDRA